MELAMMPDYTPSELQSDGNAVINIMGGVGQALGFLMATVLGFLGFKQAISDGNYISLFASGAVLALVFMGILYLFVKKNVHKDLSAKEQEIEDKADAGKPQQKKVQFFGWERLDAVDMIMEGFGIGGK